MNPNDPRVISVYGETLLRMGQLKEGTELLEKAYQLEPVPAGQNSSDKRLSALFFGHFLMNNFDKCQELAEEIVSLDNRTWLLNIEIHNNLNKDYEDLEWYKKYLDTFSKLDWSIEIDRYHLNNSSFEKKLLTLTKSLTD